MSFIHTQDWLEYTPTERQETQSFLEAQMESIQAEKNLDNGSSRSLSPTQEHTSLPWQIWRNTDGVRYEIGPSINNFFTCAYVSGFYSNEAKANAEFIVQACNAHYQLVSELTAAQEEIEHLKNHIADLKHDFQSLEDEYDKLHTGG